MNCWDLFILRPTCRLIAISGATLREFMHTCRMQLIPSQHLRSWFIHRPFMACILATGLVLAIQACASHNTAAVATPAGAATASTARANAVTPAVLKDMKRRHEKFTMLTAYSEADMTMVENANIETVLVGDSYGVVRKGYPDTSHVTMQDMLAVTKDVAKAHKHADLIADLPHNSYRTPSEAVINSKLLISAGADSVKLEGGKEFVPQVRALVAAGIAVMGHIGNTPQTKKSGTNFIAGKDKAEADLMLEDALALQAAGIYALVIKDTDPEVARFISKRLDIPTIGIGAGAFTDGQALVIDDLLGAGTFSQRNQLQIYGRVGDRTLWPKGDQEKIVEFRKRVKDGAFPSEQETFHAYSGPLLNP